MTDPTYGDLVKELRPGGKLTISLSLKEMEPGDIRRACDITTSKGIGNIANNVSNAAARINLHGQFICREHEGVVYIIRLRAEDVRRRSLSRDAGDRS